MPHIYDEFWIYKQRVLTVLNTMRMREKKYLKKKFTFNTTVTVNEVSITLHLVFDCIFGN